MMVMPANCSNPHVHYWAGKVSGSMGHLYSPPYRTHYKWLPFALDNGAFPAWSKGEPWNESTYLPFVRHYAKFDPLWILIPDVVADRAATLRSWARWAPLVREITDAPLAFAVQDGMTHADVPDADVVFVGGTTAWKRRTLAYWPSIFERVHVGRVNTEKWLWRCLEAGVESCDGTGFFRGDQKQLRGLERFLERTYAGHAEPEHANYSLSL